MRKQGRFLGGLSETPRLRAEQLIAHRGYAAKCPENTLIGIEAAIEAGARAVEIDVQFTRDGVPVLLHDPTLNRTAEVDRPIAELTLDEARRVDVCERARLGDAYSPTHIATLREFADALVKHKGVHAFVEIKRHGVAHVGAESMVERTLDALTSVIPQMTIISFVESVVESAKRSGSRRAGWILPAWNEDVQQRLASMQPEVVFCDHELLPGDESTLWQGSWKWAMYEVTSVEQAERLLARGADLIETMHIGEMLRAIEERR